MQKWCFWHWLGKIDGNKEENKEKDGAEGKNRKRKELDQILQNWRFRHQLGEKKPQSASPQTARRLMPGLEAVGPD